MTRDGDHAIAPSVYVMRPCTALKLEGHAAVFGEARQAPEQDTSIHPELQGLLSSYHKVPCRLRGQGDFLASVDSQREASTSARKTPN